MKVPVLVALHRKGFDPAEPVAVHNDFVSALPAERTVRPQPEARRGRGGVAAPGRDCAAGLACRTHDHALVQPGREPGPRTGRACAAADAVWRSVGARVSRVGRGIGDTAAAAAGITNDGQRGRPRRTRSPQSRPDRSDRTRRCSPRCSRRSAPRTWPPACRRAPGSRTRTGGCTGVRHAAGVVFPDDAPPFVLAVCATTPLAVNRPDDEACRLIRTVAAAAWQDRRDIGG